MFSGGTSRESERDAAVAIQRLIFGDLFSNVLEIQNKNRVATRVRGVFLRFVQIERRARLELLDAGRPQFRGVIFSLGCPLRMITPMQKLFLTVGGTLLFVAPLILAQAPAGAAQAAAGPDAVATNLVTTACASCHTLDRVKNKVADKDAWTTTVIRMKDKGAGLSDEQVPLVVDYLTRAAATLTVPAAGGGRGGGGRGGGGAAGRLYRLQALLPSISKCSRRRTSNLRCRTLLSRSGSAV